MQHMLDGLHTAMRMQATNQLLALQAKQSIQAQQLQITQDRAASIFIPTNGAEVFAP